MICFRDMTFCSFYKECEDKHDCHRPLTKEIEYAADRAGLLISMFAEKPECFKEIE